MLKDLPVLSVIIPAFNEEKTITSVLNKIIETEHPEVFKEIIVVDDGSTDQTLKLAEAWRKEHLVSDLFSCKIFTRQNAGKGAAVRDGIRTCTGDVVIIQDADLEYDPADYRACYMPILSGAQKVVYGSRRLKKNAASYKRYYLGGVLVTIATNIIYGSNLTDEPTCYKTFDGELIRSLPFIGNRFDWEPEVTAKLIKLGFKIHEVPISYYPRKFDEGKKIGFYDGIEAILTLMKWRFKKVQLQTAFRPKLHEEVCETIEHP